MKKNFFSILFALVLVLSFTLATTVPVMATHLYVDDDWQTGPLPYAEDTDADNDFATIQAAIDAAGTFDTVNVAAGTYREYLHITTDNLTIEGAGIDQSIIDLDGLIPYWHYSGSGSFASRAGVLITGYGSPDQIIEDVTFRGFTVKNAGLNPPITATGTHTAVTSSTTTLTDNTKSWVTDALKDQWIHNYGDRDPSDWKPARSYGLITGNDATTVTVASLSGGKENDWDTGDQYLITPYEEFHNTYWIANPNYDALRGISVNNGKNILIQNCKVTDSGYGGITTGYARLVTTHKYSEYITVDNCIVTDHPVAGISIGNNVGPFAITNNVVENIGQPHHSDSSREYMGHGIQVSGTKNYGTASGLISGNTVRNNGFEGIVLKNYADGITIEDNTVTGHNSDQDGAGIFFYGYKSNPAKMKNNIIRNNVVTGNIRGIVAYYAQESTIEGNKIKTDSGAFPEGQEGIKIDGGNNITVKNNIISCDGVGIGVSNTWNAVESYDNTFTGNTIKKAKFAGIRIRAGAHDNDFMYNTIKDTKLLTRWAGETYEETQGDGVIIDDSAGLDNVFHNNNIYNNDDDGMENQLATTVDAECNWWGHYSGPDDGIGAGLGDAVNGDIDFGPWLALPFASEFEIDKAKIDFKEEGADDKAHVKGLLGLVCYSGVSIYDDDVTVTIGSLSWIINAGIMEEKGKEGEKWEYKRPKGGTGDIKHMKIDWKKGKFDVHIDKADLSTLTGLDNLTISIEIGEYDFGEEDITMTEKKPDKWEYKAPK